MKSFLPRIKSSKNKHKNKAENRSERKTRNRRARASSRSSTKTVASSSGRGSVSASSSNRDSVSAKSSIRSSASSSYLSREIPPLLELSEVSRPVCFYVSPWCDPSSIDLRVLRITLRTNVGLYIHLVITVFIEWCPQVACSLWLQVMRVHIYWRTYF